MRRRGFYPKGGGLVEVSCEAHPSWKGITRTSWGGLVRIGGVAYASALPGVAERMHSAATKELKSGKGLSAEAKSTLRATEFDICIQDEASVEILKEQVIRDLEGALLTGLRKHLGTGQGADLTVKIDRKTGFITTSVPLPPEQVGRIAAQSFKQFMLLKYREVERLRLFGGLQQDKVALDFGTFEKAKAPPGAGIVLWAEDPAGLRLGASALGKLHKPSEAVGREAASWLLAELASGAPCDRHLADQILLWAALADSPSEFLVSEATDHVQSCAALVREGLGAKIDIEGSSPATVRVVPAQ